MATNHYVGKGYENGNVFFGSKPKKQKSLLREDHFNIFFGGKPVKARTSQSRANANAINSFFKQPPVKLEKPQVSQGLLDSKPVSTDEKPVGNLDSSWWPNPNSINVGLQNAVTGRSKKSPSDIFFNNVWDANEDDIKANIQNLNLSQSQIELGLELFGPGFEKYLSTKQHTDFEKLPTKSKIKASVKEELLPNEIAELQKLFGDKWDSVLAEVTKITTEVKKRKIRGEGF